MAEQEAQNVSAPIQVPLPEKFTQKSGPDQADAWPKWNRRFERFRIASGLQHKSETEQVSTLLYAMGEVADDILTTLKVDESKASFKDVQTALDEYFGVRKNTIVCRARFNRRVQNPGESVDSFIQDLYRLAEECNYGAMKEELICDRIVVGVLDETLSDRLQMNAKLKLDEAVRTSRLAEARAQNREVVRGASANANAKTTDKSANVDMVKKQKFHKKSSQSSAQCKSSKVKGSTKETNHQTNERCSWCGNEPHIRRRCPAKDAVCGNCKKKGHYQSVCRNKNSGSKVHTVDMDSDDELFLGAVGQDDEWMEIVMVNGQETKFKLDTGAAVTVLSGSLPWLKSVQPDKTAQELRGPGGVPLKVSGTLQATLTVGDMSITETVYLMENQPISLLSRKACVKLGLITLNRLQVQTLTETNESKIPNFRTEFPELFSGLGKLQESYRIKINSEVTPTCLYTARRVPHPVLGKVENELISMCDLGVISPVEQPTTWCSGLVPVVKPNGKVRICVDLTNLNRAVQREIYPMKSVQENLAKLSNARFFTKLDANSGFWQIPLDEKSRLLTTFITPQGRFAFNRLPFGITSAPEIFQRTMSKILSGMEGVVCHMDDVLVHAPTREEHDRRVRKVLSKLQEAGLTLNDKCEFGKTEITFLGHIVSASGIKADPKKVNAVREFPVPKTVTELQRFQGMVNQLARFVPGLAQTNAPLRMLLRKNQEFVWGPSQQSAFTKIKDILLSSVVLTHYDVNSPIVIAADAASAGIGAVLLQVQADGTRRPVCFASRSLTETEQRYAVIEKEALASTWACEQFKDYVIGVKFVLETDHKPLVPILGSKDLANMPLRIQRFKMRLMRFDYEINYVPGKLQVTADALSRAPLPENDHVSFVQEADTHAQALFSCLPASKQKLMEIADTQKSDAVLSDVRYYCSQGWPPYFSHNPILYPYWENRQHLTIVNDLLLYDDRIVIPQQMRLSMLDLIHQGHLGITKCRSRARECIWWPGLSSEIEQMVKKCTTCAKVAPVPKETLLPSSMPSRPWERVAMDLCYHNGETYVVVVDYYSRWVEFRHLKSETCKATIQAVKSIFSVHGIPEIVIYDSASEFCEFAKRYSFTHVTSSPKFPSANGEAERAVRTFKDLMKKNDDPYLAALVLRSTPLLNGLSPSELLMGRKLRTPLPILPDKLASGITKEAMENAKTKDQENRGKQKEWFNQRHRTQNLPDLLPGTQVWIRDRDEEGTVQTQHNPRSYVVATENGDYRRNRSALVDVSPRYTKPMTPQKTVRSPQKTVRSPAKPECPMKTTRCGRSVKPPEKMDL
jgi:hypothetical protein